jgi:hypothetical protein
VGEEHQLLFSFFCALESAQQKNSWSGFHNVSVSDVISAKKMPFND